MFAYPPMKVIASPATNLLASLYAVYILTLFAKTFWFLVIAGKCLA